MNWLDIIFIIITSILLIIGLVFLVAGATDDEIGTGIAMFLTMLFCAVFTGILPFTILDRGSGTTIGTITSVDKNFFGTTALYIKTSETTQERYCIEDKKVVKKAKELIGKEVKVEYGERVGLYSTGSCNSAPIEKIIELNQ